MKIKLILLTILFSIQSFAITFWKNNGGKVEKISDSSAFDGCPDDLKIFRGDLLQDQLSSNGKSKAIRAALKGDRNKKEFGAAKTLILKTENACSYGSDSADEDFSK